MMKKIVTVFSLVIVALPGLALADGPINLALFPPVQIVNETESVTAFRLGIYSKNASLTGLDLGLVSVNSGDVAGVSFTGFGVVDGNFTGWQDSWIASITKGNMQGLQSGIYTQSGLGSSGVQIGIVNISDDFSGLQFGLINITQNMRSGLQIGLVNIIQSKEKLKFFPIANWSF